jgi:hypothetical protein
MSYIGNQPAESYSAFQKQDFSTSATTSYTLDHPVANQNELALFINFVRQEPTTAYTASGTTLTLTSATASSDDMYCVYLGKAVQTVNPPSGSVGSSQVAASIITGQTAETSIATDDTVLIHDTSAGALRKMTRANFVSGVGGTNTPAFEAFLSSDTSQLSNDTDTKVTFDTEIYDSDGTYDTSNGRFTPAVAGKYVIYGRLEFDDSAADANQEHMVKIFKNGSQASVFFCLPNQKDSLTTYIEVFDLGSSDYIEIYAKINNSDGARRINGNSATQKSSTFGAFKLLT